MPGTTVQQRCTGAAPRELTLEAQATLIAALHDPGCYPHAVGAVRHIETHISHILLTGPYAYKIKKTVNLGFLDFSTLRARRFFCEQEIRLNRRLAPELYMEVVPIGGTPHGPAVGATEDIIEYAVKMTEFPQAALLDAMLTRGELHAERIEAVAFTVAEFHERAARAHPGSGYGTPAAIEAAMRDNLVQLVELAPSDQERARLEGLRTWSLRGHRALTPAYQDRLQQGFVRECHGDLHVGNVASLGGTIQIFDCIEFDPRLRWIDVADEIAFFAMDLEGRGHVELSYHFLNAYLERTGDYAAVPLLRGYEVYRALVRAKVARIRSLQPHLTDVEQRAALASFRSYVGLAERLTVRTKPVVVLLNGLSASGKTTLGRALAQRLPAFLVRSDVGRKRLLRPEPKAASGSAVDGGIYTEQATRATYNTLARIAGSILDAGHVALVDATSLKRWQRNLMADVAAARGADFVIVECRSDLAVLRRRLVERQRLGRDASEATEAVLERQIRECEPLRAGEQRHAVSVDTERVSPERASETVAARLRGRHSGRVLE